MSHVLTVPVNGVFSNGVTSSEFAKFVYGLSV